jgi:hypothetical protein
MAAKRLSREQALALRTHYARSADLNSRLWMHALVDGRLRTAARREQAYRRAATRCRRLGALVRGELSMTSAGD